jgi:Acyl-CoA synthetases (AMP-forming)/AMP-acid ligases II
MAMSLLKALRLNARRVPQRTALRFRDTRLSYAELLQATERAMCALAALGIAPGEKVPLLSFNHPDMLVAYFALTGLGAVPAPLNYRLSDDDLRWGMDAAHARWALLGSGFAERAQALADPARRWIWFGDAAAQAPQIPHRELRWDALLAQAQGAPPEGRDGSTIMLHTSGTTGRPKGALRSRFGFEERAIEQGFGMDDHTLCVLPLCLSAGCVYALLPLYLGASVSLHEHFDAGTVLDAIERERIHSAMLLPAMLQRMVEHPRFATADLRSLRVIQSGAGAIPAALKRTLLDRLGDGVLNIYAASTEVGPYANLKGPELRAHLGACRALGVESENAPRRGQFLPDSQPHSGAMGQEDGKKWAAAAHSQPTIPKSDRLLEGNCVGRPFFGVELKLLDDDGHEVPTGEVGEI